MPVTFCITILILYYIPLLYSSNSLWKISSSLNQYIFYSLSLISLSLSHMYLAAYSIFWVCVLFLGVFVLSPLIKGKLIGSLGHVSWFLYFWKPCKQLILSTCMLKESWNKMMCRALRFIDWVLLLLSVFMCGLLRDVYWTVLYGLCSVSYVGCDSW